MTSGYNILAFDGGALNRILTWLPYLSPGALLTMRYILQLDLGPSLHPGGGEPPVLKDKEKKIASSGDYKIIRLKNKKKEQEK